MAIFTHRALAQAGVLDTAKQNNPLASVGPACKHFWPMTETGAIAQLSDIAGGANIVNADLVAVTNAPQTTPMNPGAANAVNMLYWGGTGVATQVGLSAPCAAPMDKDFMLIMCCRYKEDVAFGDQYRIGMASTYYGGALAADIFVGDFNAGTFANWGIPQIVLHPGFAQYHSYPDGNFWGFSPPRIETLPYAHPQYTWSGRAANTDHIFAAVRRGDYLEHWADGVMTGRAAWYDTQVSNSPGTYGITERNWYNTDFANGHIDRPYDVNAKTYRCSHGGYGLHKGPGSWEALDGNSGAVAEFAQDYYGKAFFTFQDGAPTDVGEALTWMLSEWGAGNKVLWPGWVALN